MIIRIQKKLVLFLAVALIIVSIPLTIVRTGNYLETRSSSDSIKTSREINNDNYVRPSGGSCGGSGCGCGCGGAGTAKPRTEVDVEQTGDKIKDAENAGYKYYVDTYGDSDIEARVKDYGCHVEVEILKNGQIVKKLGYSRGSIYEY